MQVGVQLASLNSIFDTEMYFICSELRLFNLGRYVAMSICQGSSGFPFLAEPVYMYLCTGKSTDISIDNWDAPDLVLQFALQKVNNIDCLSKIFNCAIMCAQQSKFMHYRLLA